MQGGAGGGGTTQPVSPLGTHSPWCFQRTRWWGAAFSVKLERSWDSRL